MSAFRNPMFCKPLNFKPQPTLMQNPEPLAAAVLTAVAGGSGTEYELNPPSAVDYLWSSQGPVYQDGFGSQISPGQLPDWLES